MSVLLLENRLHFLNGFSSPRVFADSWKPVLSFGFEAGAA
jgi:hypothetical protein